MSQLGLQSSFNSGEWAPALAARVDLQKYRAGAALLQNFFVDYRGGASTRPGTKYVIQAYKSSTAVRLIPFQIAFDIGYILEFGNQYIRFIYDGSPVLENPFTISAATNANPCILTTSPNNYNVGDWIYVAGISGMTQLNGRYFSVLAATSTTVTLGDLNGDNIDSTSYGAYTSGGTTQRIYTLASPYAAADLALVKFSQSINQMILCHPNYPPQSLTITSATDWSISPITIGTPISAPTGLSISTTLSSGSVNYGYAVTAVDQYGNESSPLTGTLNGYQNIASVAGTNHLSWTASTGAVSYNCYKSNVSYFGVISSTAEYGFIGTTTGTTFDDTNIGANFSESPPVIKNPIATGSQVIAVSVTNAGNYSSVPSVSFSGGGGSSAAASAVLGVVGLSIANSGSYPVSGGNPVGSTWTGPDECIIQITGAAQSTGALAHYYITDVAIISPGAATSGSVPSQFTISGGGWEEYPVINLTWGVTEVNLTENGSGYSSAPSVSFSPSGATATALVGAANVGYPGVVSFFQERMVLAATASAPQTIEMSQPGSYFNFNVHQISEADDAITATLVSGVLNTIKAIVSSTAGMLLLTDKASWLVNGGSSGSAVTPSAIVANAQSWIGISDVPPIVANYDVLYVQSKGSAVRDLAYNIYFNVFTGTDISVIASHLFYGYTIKEWAWAEQPFYVVWAVRNDGVMLTLTYLKEQEFVGWSHQVTAGLFMSVASVTESTTDAGNVDAVYTVVQRTVNGNTVQYIERVAERNFPSGAADAWCVDCALGYSGTPQSSFQGAEHLAGLTVTGLADGVIIPSFTMPASGEFTIPAAASKVTVGLGFTAQLQTLALDIPGDQTQGKVKKIPHVDVRVNQTLGLTIGPDFDHQTPMKDLVVGNVSSMLTGQETQIVSGLYTGDARTFLPNSAYTVPGQYCIEQSNPLPATVLGCFPAFEVGDDK